jgi:cyclic beta-1,2-glucan synthetase
MSISIAEQATAPSTVATSPVVSLADLLGEPQGPEPIRAELFGLERLDAHARQLAAACITAPPRLRNSPLLARFAENARALASARDRIVDDASQRQRCDLDAEWLVDNYHIVEHVLSEIREDLPQGYDQELPKLAGGPGEGYPRVYAVAVALVAHTDSELDEARIEHFVQAFQEVAPLSIGELWALPTMFRLVLIENLRRLADKMLWGWDERTRAEELAATSLATPAVTEGGHAAEPRLAAGASFSGLTDPFVVRVLQLLRDHGAAIATLERLEAELARHGVDANEVLRREHRRQAANQISVGNCVISLRLISALDWNAFFERLSLVDVALRDDPAGVYALQDFATRDRYRRMVERIARAAGVDETTVARRAVALAAAALQSGQGAARAHVGYYLIDRGRALLRAEFGDRGSGRERLLDWVLGHPRTVYFGSLALVFGLLMTLLVAAGAGAGWLTLLLAIALAVPVSELTVGVVNHAVTLLLPPRSLPKLEFKDGIPDEFTTFIVMPTMLVRPGSAEALLERLEIHYLANPDPNLRFALLTDFADADDAERPEDQGYVNDALERVAALNDRYRCKDGSDRFFLFHRERLWNPKQGCWMGWERKRGKLTEFNRLLRGDRGTSYRFMSADPSTLPEIRFVITLDADTQLPRDCARRLVGALAHPLNRPRFDGRCGRVVEGYGVLQPRVSFHLTAATHSRFASLLAASGGIDPYSSAASDTYMDLFGVGSFTGKGIYEVDAFEEATGNTFPDNQILSHDLIEGNYARCGLLSDTELFDDFPARYHAYARREHRWVRGDWQLLPWLGPRVPAPDGWRANPLPTLERWKLFDNLRRSLVAPALVLLLALGWTVLPGSPWLWTATAVAVPALPLFQTVVCTLVGCVRSRRLASLKCWSDSVPAAAAQGLIGAAFLADQACRAVDAVARTLVRLYVSRRNLLEWETAATTDRRLGAGLDSFILNMGPASLLAAVVAAVVAFVQPANLLVAAPVLLAWFGSPLLAYWISRPRPVAEAPLSADEQRALRRVARRTWHFFETFVGDEDHWLPPDNFQEEPDGRVAHRTSPTNQGLLLLSTLAAHDLGYIGLDTLAKRLEKTFDTFERMERHWGHFYNWYNTRTLRPLNPAYLSTVDSGNLLGCLVALKQGLREKVQQPWIGPEAFAGLADTLALAADALRGSNEGAGASLSSTRAVEEQLRRLGTLLGRPPVDLLEWADRLRELDEAAAGLGPPLNGQVHLNGHAPAGDVAAGLFRPAAERAARKQGADEFATWAWRFTAQVQGLRALLDSAAPWIEPLRACECQGGLAWSSEEQARRWGEVRADLVAPTSAAVLAERVEALAVELEALAAAQPAGEGLRQVAAAFRRSSVPALRSRLLRLAERAQALGDAMEFRPLYKPDRHLYAIGCNLVQGRLDGACYDLLASESCLTSLLTIARGDAPRRHWFQLGRPYLRAAGRVGLVSWGGTMFEYLMPRLLMRGLPGTLVAEACRTAVARQIEYGGERGTPWGISESACFAQYVDGDFQYQSFGVPGLGLKRGLEQDLVIAPYATALAAMIAPREALENLRRLAAAGAEGEYGYYEALDYTPGRVPRGQNAAVVRSYMAHHQGMSLVALANTVLDGPMPRRFHSDPMVRAVDLLLQERVPRDIPIVIPSETASTSNGTIREEPPLLTRRLTTPNTPVPRTHLLSNSQYHVMVTNAGSGYSTCRGQDVSRWREDATRDAYGQFCYIRDVESGLVWSSGHHPVCRPTPEYEVVFASDKASFRRLDAGIETLLEITVSPEQCTEVRKVTLANHDGVPRELELTSYVEVVLGAHGGDVAHPAFGKLFLETEWLPGSEALLCRRRPRSSDQKPVWAVHVSALEGQGVGPVAYETDRLRFLGRGRTPAGPRALDPGAELSGTVGPVLDPVLCLRRRVRIEPGGTASVAFTTAVAETREEALALADQYREPSAVSRAFELAWAHSQVEHRHRTWSSEDVQMFQRLASHILYAGSALRAAPAVIAANRQGQPALWRYGISGDVPIVLVRLAETSELALARQMVTAHSFLRLKGLKTDLVLLDDQPTSYSDELKHQLLELVRSSDAHDLMDRPGGVYVCKADTMAEADLVLLQAAARVVLVGDRGPLGNQLDRLERLPIPPSTLVAAEAPGASGAEPIALPADLAFANGLGGFRADGREYCLVVRGRRESEPAESDPPALPPAPWINVVANPSVGFLVSESGGGYTWAGNSQLNRLTPWANDPVSDPPGEVVYLRDEATGAVWCPTPLPVHAEAGADADADADADTLVRHGQGYTTFERQTHGLRHELTLLVPPDDPVKLLVLKLVNPGDRARRISATFYAEWVLGTTREAAASHVVTELDEVSGSLLARNAFRADFSSRLAFADVNVRPRTVTADRLEFLGRNGALAAPAALGRVELSGRVGAALDPCAAIQAKLELAPGEERTLVFLLGEADSAETARALRERYAAPGSAEAALDAVKARWDSILSAVQVRTPNPALDLMLNRWLIYQVVSCRLWGRSAFYQSGGAYGFRDQLQDVMSLVYGAPGEARAQILRAAARQFVEGDVQHWWHPPLGRGVRTRFSDDLLWLPLVVGHYVATTGDAAILDEPVPFLKGRLLAPEQEEEYGLPAVASESASLYDHCLRALDHGLRLGAHGLPLMGTGDWNDGMNKVGAGGKGESVWDAWFLVTILRRFAELAGNRGDSARAARCREQAESLRAAIEANAWDGSWYRRAYFDDGTPLGSASNDECQIDSIAQTWAAISGTGDPERTRRALAAVDERLVREDDGLILLFTPPFDCGSLEPGYIKGYVPGIRENGGQYTHAATWVVLAAALQGHGRRAVELFDLLNPVHHAADPASVARYKVEPYVVAADVYGRPPHTGRGGWTWYTGSASWLYRVGLESILGFQLRGDRLLVDPCIPGDWPGFEVVYRHRSAVYRIRVENPEGVERGVASVELDGQPLGTREIPLADDGQTHDVIVRLGPATRAAEPRVSAPAESAS